MIDIQSEKMRIIKQLNGLCETADMNILADIYKDITKTISAIYSERLLQLCSEGGR